ncbi:MAG: peptide chain release factor 1, partial [Puniceicoccaceae bacterium]|nr:peptide chain release factor 1 [Puniceicoccaceae bacterium]
MHKIPDIAPFRSKLEALDAQMAAPDFFSDARKATEVSREHQRLSTLIEHFERYHGVEQQLLENEELLAESETDTDLIPMIEEEQISLKAEKEDLVHAVLKAMVPPDPSDSRN